MEIHPAKITRWLFIISLCMMIGTTFASDATIYDLNLTGRNCTYQIYLPASNPRSGKHSYSNADDSNIPLNTASDIQPLTFPIRVSWEITISNCTDGQNIKTPGFMIKFYRPDGSTSDPVVSESFYNDTHSGSFVLPAHTGMMVETNTGAWDQPFNAYTDKHNGYDCRYQITYRPADKDIPVALQHLDANVFNTYVSEMIKTKEPEMKAALLKENNITDFKLQDAKFDILTGNLWIQFIVYYKTIDIQGALNFEIRVTDGSPDSPKIGGYCSGLEGNLHSSRFLADVILAFAKNAINKHLVGRQFWSDSQIHREYKVFKNDKLADIVNQAFIDNAAGNEQFKKIRSKITDIGTIEAEFKNIKCNQLDISTGQANISFDIAAALKSDLGFDIAVDKAGSAIAGFDLYINCEDQSWWVKLDQFKLTINGLPELDDVVQNLVNQELNHRRVLIRIDMPQSVKK